MTSYEARREVAADAREIRATHTDRDRPVDGLARSTEAAR